MMALVYDQSDLSISRVKGWRFGYKKALEHSLWGQQNSYMSYKKIVQAGAGGSIGAPVLKALVDSGQFDVTVLTRKSSNYKPPYNSITVVPVDYTNHAELVEALRGNDALVVTLGDFTSSERNHHALTDAAIKAGLKCIIPSTFASDLSNPPGSEEETFRPHLNNMAYIRSKQAEIGHIFITNGCFFEWDWNPRLGHSQRQVYHLRGWDAPVQRDYIRLCRPYRRLSLVHSIHVSQQGHSGSRLLDYTVGSQGTFRRRNGQDVYRRARRPTQAQGRLRSCHCPRRVESSYLYGSHRWCGVWETHLQLGCQRRYTIGRITGQGYQGGTEKVSRSDVNSRQTFRRVESARTVQAIEIVYHIDEFNVHQK